MSLLKSLTLGSALFISLIIFGCSDDAIMNNSEGVISGKIYGEDDITLPNVQVSINYGPAITSSSDGSFRFTDVPIPYDLNVFSKTGSFYYQYKGVTTATPNIKLPVLQANNYNLNAEVNIKHPRIPNTDRIYFRFLSPVKAQVFLHGTSDSTANIGINWDGQDSVTGKLLYIQVKQNSSGEIESYEKAGYKDLLIKNLKQYNVGFSAQEINYNPQETHITILRPAGYLNNYLSAYIYFRGYYQVNTISLLQYTNSAIQNITVPATLPLGFKLGYNFYSSDTVDGNTISAQGFMEPGESYSIEPLSTINLEFPPDGQDSVDYNTEFSHNEQGNVYRFSIGNYSVITTQRSIHIPVAFIYGIYLPENTILPWYVEKYNAAKIDDILMSYDRNYPTRHIISVKTKVRTIKTFSH